MRRSTFVAMSVLVCVLGGGSAVRGQNMPKSLSEAASTGDVEVIKQYIAKKANLNAADAYGYTPLKRAVEGSQLEAVKALLEGGANPNTKDDYGMTPLHLVCNAGQKDFAEALLTGKADIEAKDGTGRTPIHCAVQMGHVELAEFLIGAGANVNATDVNGQTPLGIAQRLPNVPELAELLRKHGGTLPVIRNPEDIYGNAGVSTPQGTEVVGGASQRPADFVIDANAIREDLKKFAALEAPLKAVDANSQSEQRTWISRRSDNRTNLLRFVQKQFEEEMTLVKRIAVEEKAAKTTKAVDDLVAARKSRYTSISEQLRDQRRQTLNESRNTMSNTGAATGTRGRGSSSRGGTRGGRSSDGAAGGYTGTGSQNPYGTNPQTRTPRRPTAAVEVNEPPVTADTQAQIQAWLNSQPENRADLLSAVHELDVVEYAALHATASEENAAKTGASIMALLMLREERIAKINQKWTEDDERMQRMQGRMGTDGMQGGAQPGMQQGTQQGMRGRGRR